jgi:WD40 repeat protein
VSVRGVAFSPDGRLLASADGNGLIVLWDPVTGGEVRRWRGHAFGAAAVAFTPDGKTLVSAAHWESCPRLWDPATGKAKGPDAGHHSAIEHLAFAADGKALFTMGRDLRILRGDLATGREALWFDALAAAPGASGYSILLRSPDDRTAATWDHKGGAVRLWDTATGKEQRGLGEAPGKSDSTFRVPFAFSADGRWLAVCGKDGIVQVWGMSDYQRHPFAVPGGPAHALMLSRDGSVLAVSKGDGVVYIWDLVKNKELRVFRPGETTDALALSPDGQHLATAYGYKGAVRLWDTATGREVRPLRGGPTGGYELAFSPDGRLLAAAGGDQDAKVHVWEVATGLQARELSGLRTAALAVAFSPDGRVLASGGGDSTALLWDLTGKDVRRAARTPALLEARWYVLAGDDAALAYQAIWDLASDPSNAVPFLKTRLRPVEAVSVERMAGLIGELGSDEFRTREKATQELENLIDVAEPALRRALEKDPAAEVRRRVEGILEKQEPAAVPARLQQLRAVGALEYAGTPEAVELLKILAAGAPTALQTKEAKAALGRLQRTRPATP